MTTALEDDIRSAIAAGFDDATSTIEVDGNRALIVVTSAAFESMSRVAKQQAVYACIEDMIADGRLHAVTIRAETPK